MTPHAGALRPTLRGYPADHLTSTELNKKVEEVKFLLSLLPPISMTVELSKVTAQPSRMPSGKGALIEIQPTINFPLLIFRHLRWKQSPFFKSRLKVYA